MALVRIIADLESIIKYIAVHVLVTNFSFIVYHGDSVAVAHQIYGVAQTINSANYMYFKALEKVLSLNHPQCINIFTGTCLVA